MNSTGARSRKRCRFFSAGSSTWWCTDHLCTMKTLIYVIRRYDSLAQREEREGAYYSSDDWRKGPREQIPALIENYAQMFRTG